MDMTQKDGLIMTTAGPATLLTPKRKRSQLENSDADVPIFDTLTPADIALPPSSPADDGSTSPRTKVAHRFRSLAIGRPRSVAGNIANARIIPVARAPTVVIPETPQPKSRSTRADAMEEDTDRMVNGARKRIKSDDEKAQIPSRNEDDDSASLPNPKPRSKPPKPGPAFALERPATPPPPRKGPSSATETADPLTTATTTSGSTAQRGLSQPFQWPPSPPDTSLSPQADHEMVAFRASMTWQEDEITIYDPDDSDDDGTGINGIGFKPTAAVAYARGVKRKQQLAEYRKREEREARARRSQRRRASPRAQAKPVVVVGSDKGGGKKADQGEREVVERRKEKNKERRRVRFSEASVATPAPLTTGS